MNTEIKNKEKGEYFEYCVLKATDKQIKKSLKE